MRDGVERGAEIDLLTSLGGYRSLLSSQRESLNVMNVFPVADCDTGNNMLSTVDAIIEPLGPALTPHEIAVSIARSALEGRGNSGLLLGQYLAGFASGLAEGGVEVAFGRGAELARRAVGVPVEGTLLSVADDAAGGTGSNLGEVVADARGRAAAALARTPSQLSVLADAGVLDSGGAGLTLFFDALWLTVTGLAQVEPAEGVTEGDSVNGSVVEGAELQFSTDALDRLELIDALQAIGDSVVVVEAGQRLSAHVHVTAAGPAIVEVADLLGGVPVDLHVEPLLLRVNPSEAGSPGD